MAEKKSFLPVSTAVPDHLVIIPDGNRRWARARGLPTFDGHRRGFDLTPEIARACRDFGIHTLTIWAFSTENWDRSQREITYLMKKYEDLIIKHLREAKKDKARIIHLGRKDRLPSSLVRKIEKAEEETKENKKHILNIALDYGGRDEILRAVRKMLAQKLDPEKLNEKVFTGFLDTCGQPYPYPDLVIRTSGEQRLSGFLPWQAGYAEIYWLEEHFPDFTVEKLKEAILDYSRRRRRFGGNDNLARISFSPEKLARLEVGWWQAHNNKDKKRLFSLLVDWTREHYRLKKEDAREAIKFLVKAVKLHDARQWEKAVASAASFYRVVKRKTKLVFHPETVARLEIDWWRFHDKLGKSINKFQLEQAFRKLYGEIYQLSGLQTAKMAHLKALATVEYDLRHWHLAQDYLSKCYRALQEVAS